ncbi:sperm microtubule associated protein 2-like [Branchiostoma lanceolatum]|uniref:sperm microtubule associated protein 2-like n=1 Tax=Branchiostoma lanceolatum TaxID=7740 RepID=UPI003454D840
MATQVQVSRIDVLSRPKPIPPGHIEDRRSVYWIDRAPPTVGPDGTTKCRMNKHQLSLVKVKDLHPEYLGDRPTPIWAVSLGALGAKPRPRLDVLCRPKALPADYQPKRSVYSTVPESAKRFEATGRLEQLAAPKMYGELKIKNDTEWDWGEWRSEIPPAAMKATATPRVETLAEAKRWHPEFLANRTVQWAVSDNAKTSIATIRLQQLSRPKSRGGNDDYDPYKVPRPALLAQASARISELCTPIPRKVRQKKIV